MAKVRENTKAGIEYRDAVNDAVSMAIKENLLEGFFERQRSEVIEMILTEFNEEVFKQNVREDGYLEGLAEGASKKAMEDAENLLKMNVLTDVQISQAIGLPLEKVQKIAESLVVKA